MVGSMSRLDPFTRRRLLRFVEDFRARSGQLPTSNDLAKEGFDDTCIKAALKEKLIEEFYVTLTSGTIVKGYKLSSS
jgi:hypothetical protein